MFHTSQPSQLLPSYVEGYTTQEPCLCSSLRIAHTHKRKVAHEALTPSPAQHCTVRDWTMTCVRLTQLGAMGHVQILNRNCNSISCRLCGLCCISSTSPRDVHMLVMTFRRSAACVVEQLVRPHSLLTASSEGSATDAAMAFSCIIFCLQVQRYYVWGVSAASVWQAGTGSA